MMRAQRRTVLFVVATAAMVIFVATPPTTATTQPNWLTPTPTVTYFSDDEQVPTAQDNMAANPCVKQVVSFYNPYGNPIAHNSDPSVPASPGVQTSETCVHMAKSFRMARFQALYCSWAYDCRTLSWMGISFPGDAQFHRITNLMDGSSSECWLTSPSTDGIYHKCGGFYAVKDLPGHLTPQFSGNEHYFAFDTAGYSYTEDERGQTPQSLGSNIAANGQWAVVALRDIGFVRINLVDSSYKLFTKDVPPLGYGADPQYQFSITDDGQYIVAGGNNVGAKVYQLHDTCGEVASVIKTSWYDRSPFAACPSQDLVPPILQSASGNATAGFKALWYVKFSNDGGQITGFYVPWQGAPDAKAGWLTISAAGYTKSTMNYLALGDSFSSGEGDLGKKADGSSYYLEGTAADGMCHLSSRSYPFLLRDAWGMNADQVHSVACSGAQVVFDYTTNLSNYDGQGRRLSGSSDKVKLQTEALDQFIPGRVPQLEFITKYKPSVITLTGGGNDVGFSDVLAYCATPTIIFGFVPINDTCGYAINQEMHTMLWDSIHTQYIYNKLLINKIKAASPESKVYLIGYPSFIAGSSANCAANAGLLDGLERNMINDAVTELNKVQQRVAHDTGIDYIDIEDSLDGGRLCEGSEYMTGFADVKFDSSSPQMFHPNAQGHNKMADMIKAAIGDDPLRSSTSSQSLALTIDAPSQITRQGTIVNSQILQVGSTVQMSLPAGSFQGGTSVSAQGRSTPTDLGVFVANGDGSLTSPITIPAYMGIGRHVLIVKGVSNDGSPVTYYQFIAIRGSDMHDIDADGVPDNEDACMFIQHWYDESTGKDVCNPVVNAQSPGQTKTDNAANVATTNTFDQSSRRTNLVPRIDTPQTYFDNPTTHGSSLLAQQASVPLATSKNSANGVVNSTVAALLSVIAMILSAILLIRNNREKR